MFINTPPMGWNTWNTFGADISEKLVMESADAMIQSGLKDLGYEYVVIDDIWALTERGEDGRLVPDPEKFPHGMKYVSDYVHSLGLKFGMYSCASSLTCAGYPASYQHEWVDAKTFAEWGVDFLKYDFCFHPMVVRADILYKRMSLALANSGRDILFSACSWGSEHTKQWIKETGAHTWRSTHDIVDTWDSIKKIAQSQICAQEYNGKGCFNDMDMLVVGMNGKGHVGLAGCSYEEYRLHFSLWALLNSPLMIGCDIRSMTPQAKQILSNRDVIAINQDPLCSQPFLVNNMQFQPNECRGPEDPFFKEYPLEIPMIAKYLNNGDIAIGIFNFTDSSASPWKTTIPFDNLGLAPGKRLELTNLWTGETKKSVNDVIRENAIPAHDCILLRAKIIDA